MTDNSIARVVKTYQWIREKMSSEEMQMLSSMLYIDVLRMGSERVRADEQLKMESYRARTAWKNESYTPLSWEKKIEPKAEKTEKPSIVEKKVSLQPVSKTECKLDPKMNEDEEQKAIQETIKNLPF